MARKGRQAPIGWLEPKKPQKGCFNILSSLGGENDPLVTRHLDVCLRCADTAASIEEQYSYYSNGREVKS